MSKINDGGPAFTFGTMPDPDNPLRVMPIPSLSVRDYFAGQALVGCIRAEESTDVDSIKEHARVRQRNHRAKAQAAKRAYEIADAMLSEREKDGHP